jgi:membrane-bound acyltransferase YfiQ involved in biofilm formation
MGISLFYVYRIINFVFVLFHCETWILLGRKNTKTQCFKAEFSRRRDEPERNQREIGNAT